MKVSLRKLKQKIKFLNNFQKITKSINLISAIRFQKSLMVIRKIILNVFYLMEIFRQIVINYPTAKNQLINLKERKILIIVVNSDRGLAGAFDQLIFKKTENLITKLGIQNIYLGVLGKKGFNYFSKRFNLLFSYKNFENFLPENLARELFNYLNYLIEQKKITEIYFIRSNLTSFGFQVEDLKIFPYDNEVISDLIEKILPQMKEWENLKIKKPPIISKEFIFEPNYKIVISTILKNVFYLILYILILESQASLELTRTLTMRKASENAQKIKNKNILEYNTLRQQRITEELIDLLRS